jgi:chromosome segregation ATPase
MAELLEIADELYGLRLPDFTPARDARAKELKGTDLARQVKALRKPSTAAWVVNLLVRRDTEQVEQVLSVGEALREAQASMSGEELRTLTRQRRQLTAAVTTQARRTAKEAGTKVTDAVAEQVEATLTAAMVDERCAQAVRSGLLVAPLSTTGLEPADPADVAGAVALPEALGFTATAREEQPAARPELHVVPDPEADRKALAAAEERLAAAEAELADATAAHDEARTAADELEARGLQLQSEIDELRGRIADLESQAEDVDEELSEAEDSGAEAEEAVTEATRARDAARAALERLKG